MKRTIAAALVLITIAGAIPTTAGTLLPDSVYVGGQLMHVQGIAVDTVAQRIYMSFTTRFIVSDYYGNIVGSIDRIQGHLGGMTFDPAGRKVYASLEFKDDEIGAGINKKLDVSGVEQGGSRFYIAIIDVDKVTGPGIDPEKTEVLKTVHLAEVGADYNAEVQLGNNTVKHRYGCSGIDGVTIAPAIGRKGKRQYLYVAYGIYSDINREDNNYQVLLRYKLKQLLRYGRGVIMDKLPAEGPEKASKRYFVLTGNTNYGVQNLAYDATSGEMFMAVYKGKKPQYPNYTLFHFPISTKAEKGLLKGVAYDRSKHLMITKDGGEVDGLHFKWGSTGLSPIGDNLWYFSENHKDKDTNEESCTARLYRYDGKGFTATSK